MYIGKKLRQLRVSLGLNQDDMASQIGVSQSYYSSIERGKKPVSKKLLEDIMIKWKISKSYFENDYSTKSRLEYEIMGGYNRGLNGGLNENVASNNDQIEWDVHRSINAGGIDPQTQIPFYLSRYIFKKLTLDIFKRNDEIGRLEKDKSTIGSFMYILENIDHYYFRPINDAQNDMKKFYDGKNFDYKGYYDYVIAEIEKLLKFSPAFGKLSAAVEEFYKEIKDVDQHNLVDGFFGKDVV